jgi:hypothetical protein
MKNLFFLIIVIIFDNCNSFPEKQDTSTSFYSDIDIFNLKGVGIIKSNKPKAPCFEIDSVSSNNIRLIIWYSDSKNYTRNYVKQDDFWVASYSIRADTLALIVHSYIGNGKIVYLDYKDDSSSDNLRIAVVYNDSVDKIYFFKDNLHIKPGGDINFAEKDFDNLVQGMGINEYHIREGNLQIIRTNISKSPVSIVKDTVYYKIGNHSIFWWNEIGK